MYLAIPSHKYSYHFLYVTINLASYSCFQNETAPPNPYKINYQGSRNQEIPIIELSVIYIRSAANMGFGKVGFVNMPSAFVILLSFCTLAV